MLWAISCLALPNTEELRQKKLEAHRAYLKSQKGILVLSAPMIRDDDDTTFLGSLRIVNVNSRAEAEAFSDGDPLVQSGMFASITITRMRKGQWNPEVAEGA